MAAVTFTKLANATTKNCLAYQITADGAANATLAQATIAADVPAGPLKTLLTAATADSDAHARDMLFNSSKVRTTITVLDATTGANWKIEPLDDGATNQLAIKATAAAADATFGAVLKIEYRHSMGR